ncbi:MAG: hypothetical protein ACK4U0_15935 [Mesorhizobium sp.]
MAWGHASERGHVLLLPTGHYLFGGALAVVASFAVMAFIDPMALKRLGREKVAVGSVLPRGRMVASLLSWLVLAGLLAAGLLGSRDPLSNPLPLTFWSVFWVGLVLLQGLAGNVWYWLDPWYGPVRLARMLARRPGEGAPLPYPKALAYWPAVAGFAGFAWFELVYEAPDDPARLAVVLGFYWLATFAMMLVFGHRAWSRKGEFLSVFLGMVGRIGVVSADDAREGGADRPRIALAWPGARLADQTPLPPIGTLFLVLALASVSFDGLMRSFFWLGLAGINPLEFPGRSAVTWQNTAGIAAMAFVLGAAFLIAVWAGERLAGRRGSPWPAAGALVWSLMPIALAYHFSHYLTALLVNGQYALAAISDPLSNGWNLFGTAGLHVSAGLVLGAGSAWVLWNVQAGVIVVGHVMAVLAAHAIAGRSHGSAGTSALSQAPLAALMVGYTVFGLWLLSTPTGY